MASGARRVNSGVSSAWVKSQFGQVACRLTFVLTAVPSANVATYSGTGPPLALCTKATCSPFGDGAGHRF
jgi:hypothetical protein